MKNIFILVIHFQISQLLMSAIQCGFTADERQAWKNYVRIMEINIWLLEALFILSIQYSILTFDYW